VYFKSVRKRASLAVRGHVKVFVAVAAGGAAAGLPDDLRIHDLRHTNAALLIAQGAHPKAIQTHLGHSSIQVTLDLYGHLYPDEMDRLAAHLDAAHGAKPPQVAASVRHPGGAEVIEFPLRSGKRGL
jgi:integrase